MAEVVYHGEQKCEALYKSGPKRNSRCDAGAYFQDGDELLCGRHSNKETRTALPKMGARMRAERKKIANTEAQRLIEEAARANSAKGAKGQVVLTKKRFMGEVEPVPGYIQVFPNFKDGGKTTPEGNSLGMSALSPKSLGPVDHGMPGIPAASTVENYHQFAKIFPYDLEDKKISEWSLGIRRQAYRDETPYRHKGDFPAIKEKVKDPRKQDTLYSVFYNHRGEARTYSYIECRFFYCVWYERLAKRQANLHRLLELLDKGYNLQVIGYDAQEVAKPLYDHYLDPSNPFGHEFVLYTMLTVADPTQYPWRKYRDEHPDLYDGFLDLTPADDVIHVDGDANDD